MRMKVLLFLLLPLMTELIASCCDCLDPVTKHYTNKSISINHLNNSGSQPVVTTSGPIPKMAYGIRMQLIRETTTCIEKPTSVFIQSAYAFSCGCPPPFEFLPKDSIASIKVFTLNDFDTNHKANADVSDYFKVYRQFSFATISDYLKSTPSTLYEESELVVPLDLLLMNAPSVNNQHKFKLQIALSDGRILEEETSQIELR